VLPSCKGTLFEIGLDESQRLDVVHVQYRVTVPRRPKLACRTRRGAVLQHAAPDRLIKAGLPTERLVAHVIDAKSNVTGICRFIAGADFGDAQYRYRPFHAHLLGRLCRPDLKAPVVSSAPEAACLVKSSESMKPRRRYWIRGAARPKSGASGALARDWPWAGPEPAMHRAVAPSMA
jgi:hypothetical protein